MGVLFWVNDSGLQDIASRSNLGELVGVRGKVLKP